VGFIYQEAQMQSRKDKPDCIEIRIRPHVGILGRCSQCQREAPGYDRLAERRWLFVPLWGIPTYFRYAPRRVQCAEHGVVVEHIPWSDGKRPVTCAMMGFLARWLARNRAGFPDKLGGGVSLGGMVRAVGPGPSRTAAN
jgi:transposase